MIFNDDIHVLISIPEELYNELKEDDRVCLIKKYNKDSYSFYKDDKKWIKANEKYKEAKERKEKIEDLLDYKNLNK